MSSLIVLFLRGRSGRRRVSSKPSCAAVALVQSAWPNGVPRRILRRCWVAWQEYLRMSPFSSFKEQCKKFQSPKRLVSASVTSATIAHWIKDFIFDVPAVGLPGDGDAKIVEIAVGGFGVQPGDAQCLLRR